MGRWSARRAESELESSASSDSREESAERTCGSVVSVDGAGRWAGGVGSDSAVPFICFVGRDELETAEKPRDDGSCGRLCYLLYEQRSHTITNIHYIHIHVTDIPQLNLGNPRPLCMNL